MRTLSTVFILLVSLLFGLPTHPSEPCQNLLASLRQTHPLEIEPFRLTVGNDSFSITHKLGESSAEVYLAADRKHVIKLYRSKNRFDFATVYLARLEYWRTLFLEEKGFPVAHIYAYPKTLPNGDTVVIKAYIEGLTADALRDAHGRTPDDDAIPSEDRPGLQREIEAQIGRLQNLQAKILHLYRSGEFLRWLQNKVDLEREFVAAEWVSFTADVYKESNYVLTPKGWVVIDP